MAERRKRAKKREIESYPHVGEERANNPPVGLVTPETDRDGGRKRYEHDPHLDPGLPQHLGARRPFLPLVEEVQ